MARPRRSLLLLLGLFFVALLAGFGAGSLWLAKDGPDLPTASAPAKSGAEAPEVAFEGIVYYVGAGTPATWVVDLYAIQVISSTQLITNGLPVAPGQWAQVEGVKREEGLVATTISLRAAPASSVYDRITAVDLFRQELMVGSTTVEITDTTMIQGTPARDSLAFVSGRRSAQGIIADEIVVSDSEPDTLVIGILETLSDDTWTVGDVTVHLTAGTVISGTPSVGSEVQVQGFETGAQQLQATRAWVADDLVQRQTMVGWLQRIEGQRYPYLWRMNLLDGPRLRQVYLSVHEDVVLDDSARPVAPGAWLEVVAVREDESVYRAVSVTVLSRAPKRDTVGMVESLPPSGLVGRWRVSGYQVEVTPHTGILGSPQLGSLVWVQGVPDTANVLYAEIVDVQGD